MDTKEEKNAPEGAQIRKMEQKATNCAECAAKINTVNGKFCMYLERYVERMTTPPCRQAEGGNKQEETR